MSITLHTRPDRAWVVVQGELRQTDLTPREVEVLGALLGRRYGLPLGRLLHLLVLTHPAGLPTVIASLRRKLAPEYTITDGRSGIYKLRRLDDGT